MTMPAHITFAGLVAKIGDRSVATDFVDTAFTHKIAAANLMIDDDVIGEATP